MDDNSTSGYEIKYAKTNGEDYTVVGIASTPEKWYAAQLNLYQMAVRHANEEGSRLHKMIDLQWKFLKDAEAATFPEVKIELLVAPMNIIESIEDAYSAGIEILGFSQIYSRK